MEKPELQVLLLDAVKASLEAGKVILDVYENTFSVEYKSDNSPLTIADRRSHEVIMEHLTPSGIPVLSEEGKEMPYSERKAWNELWVVDPLDGTKEFIKQNGEFTVNIALVIDQIPVLGVIYVPVEGVLYFASEKLGAYRYEGPAEAIDKAVSIADIISGSLRLPNKEKREFTMVGSRSHMNDETAEFFEGIRREYPNAEIISKGSSLKICMVAEGSADVYPRFAPTMEWDTAAGHAIARQAGFEIYNAANNKSLVYNKEDLLNPWFIVKATGSN